MAAVADVVNGEGVHHPLIYTGLPTIISFNNAVNGDDLIAQADQGGRYYGNVEDFAAAIRVHVSNTLDMWTENNGDTLTNVIDYMPDNALQNQNNNRIKHANQRFIPQAYLATKPPRRNTWTLYENHKTRAFAKPSIIHREQDRHALPQCVTKNSMVSACGYTAGVQGPKMMSHEHTNKHWLDGAMPIDVQLEHKRKRDDDGDIRNDESLHGTVQRVIGRNQKPQFLPRY